MRTCEAALIIYGQREYACVIAPWLWKTDIPICGKPAVEYHLNSPNSVEKGRPERIYLCAEHWDQFVKELRDLHGYMDHNHAVTYYTDNP
jgi:hypothetical protein